MPRNKRASDETYNRRKQAKRYINTLKRQQQRSTSAIERRALGKYIRSLDKQVQRTYRGSGYSPEKAFDVLSAQTKSGKGLTGQQRANKIFQQQIGLSSNGAKSSIGKYGKQKTKMFYAATQNIWQGLPVNKRNEAIMSKLGTGSLAEAFDIVMDKQKKAMDVVKGMNAPIGVTDENEGFYQDMSTTDYETSPDYLDYITVIR